MSTNQPKIEIKDIKVNKKSIDIKELLKDLKFKKELIQKLLYIGTSLSSEHNLDLLLERILIEAKNFTNADGGTLYLVSEDKKNLEFTVVQTDSLNIKMGGTGDKITWPPLNLYNKDGSKNDKMVAVVCALSEKTINISDVYEDKNFNFEGAKKFDEANGYRTKSVIVIPMKNYEDEVIGVLQLLNKKDGDKTVSFTKEDEEISSSLASQAAVAITNVKLIKSLENLLDSFIKTIALAIDEKSSYTGGHIERVAELAKMISEAINEDDTIYKDIKFSEDELKEIMVAAWMHDIGKITTPEYIVDKSTKLETIYDRIETIEYKFELLKSQKEVEFLKMFVMIDDDEELFRYKEQYENSIKRIDEDFKFLQKANIGSEFMSENEIQRIKEIAKYKIKINGKLQNILTEDEVRNLCIKRGTLLEEERLKINEHASIGYKMLKSLPFPQKLKKVPDIASAHHEKLNGEGYPLGLKEDEISLEMRILAIADIFEALTATDRPYRKANSLNKAFKILEDMVKNNELDKKLIKFFIDKGLYKEYADKYLLPEQKDEIEVEF